MDRKTIKRRVYDSINVLIALGRIKKEKRWLVVDDKQENSGEEIIAAKKDTLDNIRRNNTNRKDLLVRLKEQYEKLIVLKRRNEEMQDVTIME